MAEVNTEMIGKLNGFSWKLYSSVSQNGGNAIISPHSVCSALMLACLGARGNTESQIFESLGLGNGTSEDKHTSYSELNEQLEKQNTGNEGVTFSIANKLFVKKDMNVLASYAEKAEKLYKSGIVPMDFVDKSEECRLEINKWVEEQTKEKIKDLLQEGTIVPATNLVLANAVYFKGKWDKPFTADKTTECDFHVTASDVSKVQMMHGKQDMLYFVDEAEKYSAVSMSYEWKTTSMVIVRPDQIDGLSALEANFDVGKLMHSLRQSFMTKVDIALPKFTFTETTDLSQILPKLGITDLFDAANVDLSGMLEKTGVAISDVIHKAFIDVNEEGTEAAAATAMISRMMLMPMNEVSFVCDRPFLFMIVDNNTKFVHFIGRYTNP